MFLHLQVLWTTEIDGITESPFSKLVHTANYGLGVNECYMLPGHKMALCTQQKMQSPPASKLGGKQAI